MKKIIFYVGLFISVISVADTDIYFTNNTDQRLSVQTFHWGTDRLKQNDEWFQHDSEVGPFETKMLISFNRYVGVKWGENYEFETRLTSETGEQYTLRQRMAGTFWSSNIEHSMQDSDGQWYTDRNIHRISLRTQTNTQEELATKAEFTGRYDDIRYALTPLNNELGKLDQFSDSNSSGLSVMTYNIWALPVIASHIEERYRLIPNYVKHHDVLMLQEVFASGRQAFLAELAKEYPYQTKMLDKAGANIYDGGVIIVSRYPIVRQEQLVFPDCTGTDCFADKGINYAEVIKDGDSYHLFATHAASFDTDAARDLRQQQFQLMRDFAHQLNIPRHELVVYGGDFNVNKLKFANSDYPQMLANLAASEPGYAGYSASTFDPRINDFAAKYDTVEYLDYILVSNEFGQAQNNVNEVLVPRSSDASLWAHWDLSDHFPVRAELVGK